MIIERMATLAFVLAVATPAFAQPTLDVHHVAQAGAPTAGTMAEGEVRKIDKDAGKITLKHGELKSLDMPPMTMVFQVKDKALLDKVKTGDKVRFAAEKVGGQLTVTAIEASR